jgi:CubicO group peptidase (beta-lactamase class C family)
MHRHRCVAFTISIACAITLFVLDTRVPAQNAPDFAPLEKVALEELQQTNTPGAAIAIVRGDRIVMARGFGVASVETGEAVNPDMLFRLGSTTKMLTATAVNTLAEEGRLKLDAPIGTYVQGIDPKIGQVTAHQLLTHTAGVRDEAPMFGLHDETALGAGIRAMDEGFLFAPAGDVFSYSNPGYWIAGFLAEAVAGKPYADVMQEKVFAPLGMKRTTLRPTMAMTYPLAQGHSNNREIIRPAADNAASWPAGSVFSNVKDLSRFVIAILNDGRLDGKQALPAGVVKRITTGYVDYPGREPAKYGYGLTIRTFRGVRMFEHGGSRSGYGSLIRMLPDQKVGVVVLANRNGASLSRTATRALELMVPLAPAVTEPAQKPAALTAAEIADYAGAYSQTAKAEVELVAKDGQLFLKSNASLLPVSRVGANRFSVARAGSSAPQEFTLTRGKDGKTLYLHQGTRALRRISSPTTWLFHHGAADLQSIHWAQSQWKRFSPNRRDPWLRANRPSLPPSGRFPRAITRSHRTSWFQAWRS